MEAKGMVSKCVFINVLGTGHPSTINAFMERGGWQLFYVWTINAMDRNDYPLLKEILKLLRKTPVTVLRLKSNRFIVQVGYLSKNCEDEHIRRLAKEVVSRWRKFAIEAEKRGGDFQSESQQQLVSPPSEVPLPPQVQEQVVIQEDAPINIGGPAVPSSDDGEEGGGRFNLMVVKDGENILKGVEEQENAVVTPTDNAVRQDPIPAPLTDSSSKVPPLVAKDNVDGAAGPMNILKEKNEKDEISSRKDVWGQDNRKDNKFSNQNCFSSSGSENSSSSFCGGDDGSSFASKVVEVAETEKDQENGGGAAVPPVDEGEDDNFTFLGKDGKKALKRLKDGKNPVFTSALVPPAVPSAEPPAVVTSAVPSAVVPSAVPSAVFSPSVVPPAVVLSAEPKAEVTSAEPQAVVLSAEPQAEVTSAVPSTVVTPADNTLKRMDVLQESPPPPAPDSSWKMPPPAAQYNEDGTTEPVKKLKEKFGKDQQSSKKVYEDTDYQKDKLSYHNSFSTSDVFKIPKIPLRFSGDGGCDVFRSTSKVVEVAQATKDQETGGPAVPSVDQVADGHVTFMVQKAVVTPTDIPGESMVIQKQGPSLPVPDSSWEMPPPATQFIEDGTADPVVISAVGPSAVVTPEDNTVKRMDVQQQGISTSNQPLQESEDKQSSKKVYGDTDYHKDKLNNDHSFSTSMSSTVLKSSSSCSSDQGGDGSNFSSKVDPVAQAKKDQENGGAAVPSVGEGEGGKKSLKRLKDEKNAVISLAVVPAAVASTVPSPVINSAVVTSAVVTLADNTENRMDVQQQGHPPQEPDYSSKVSVSPQVSHDNVDGTADPVKKLKEEIGKDKQSSKKDSWDKDYQKDKSSDHHSFSSETSSPMRFSGYGGDGSSYASKVAVVVQANKDQEPLEPAIPSVEGEDGNLTLMRSKEQQNAVVIPTDNPGASIVVQQDGPPPPVPDSSSKAAPPESQDIVDGAAGPENQLKSSKRAPQTISIVAKVPKSSDHHLFSSSSFSDVLKSSSTFSGDGGGEGSSPASIVAPVAVAEKDHKTGGPAVPLVDKGEDGHSTFMVTDGKNYLKTSKQQQNAVVAPTGIPEESMVIQQHGPPSPVPDSSWKMPPQATHHVDDGITDPVVFSAVPTTVFASAVVTPADNTVKQLEVQRQGPPSPAPDSSSKVTLKVSHSFSTSTSSTLLKSSSSFPVGGGGDGSSSASKVAEVAQPKSDQESGGAAVPWVNGGEGGHFTMMGKEEKSFLKGSKELQNAVVIIPTDNPEASVVVQQQRISPSVPDSSSQVPSTISQKNVDMTAGPENKLGMSNWEPQILSSVNKVHHIFSASSSSDVFKCSSSFSGGDCFSSAAVAQGRKDQETGGPAVPSVKRLKNKRNAVVTSAVAPTLAPSAVPSAVVSSAIPSAVVSPADNTVKRMDVQQQDPIPPPAPDSSSKVSAQLSQNDVDGTGGPVRKLKAKVGKAQERSKKDCWDKDYQRDKSTGDHHSFSSSTSCPSRLSGYGDDGSSSASKVAAVVQTQNEQETVAVKEGKNNVKTIEEQKNAVVTKRDHPVTSMVVQQHGSLPPSTDSSSKVVRPPVSQDAQAKTDQETAGAAVPSVHWKEHNYFAVMAKDGKKLLKRLNGQKNEVVPPKDYPGALTVIQQQGPPHPVPESSWKGPPTISQDNVDRTAGPVKKLKSSRMESQTISTVTRKGPPPPAPDFSNKMPLQISQDKQSSKKDSGKTDYQKDKLSYYDSFTISMPSTVFKSSWSFSLDGGADYSSFASKVVEVAQAEKNPKTGGQAVPSVDEGEDGHFTLMVKDAKKHLKKSKQRKKVVVTPTGIPEESMVIQQQGLPPPVPASSWKMPPPATQCNEDGTAYPVVASAIPSAVVTPADNIVKRMDVQQQGPSPPAPSSRMAQRISQDKQSSKKVYGSTDYHKDKLSYYDSFTISMPSIVFKSSSSYSLDGGAHDSSSASLKVAEVAQAKNDQKSGGAAVPWANGGEGGQLTMVGKEKKCVLKRSKEQQNAVVIPTDYSESSMVIQQEVPSAPAPDSSSQVPSPVSQDNVDWAAGTVKSSSDNNSWDKDWDHNYFYSSSSSTVTPTDIPVTSMVTQKQDLSPSVPGSSSKASPTISQDNVDGTAGPMNKLQNKISKVKVGKDQRSCDKQSNFFSSSFSSNVLKSSSSFFGGDDSSTASKVVEIVQAKKDGGTAGPAVSSVDWEEYGRVILTRKKYLNLLWSNDPKNVEVAQAVVTSTVVTSAVVTPAVAPKAVVTPAVVYSAQVPSTSSSSIKEPPPISQDNVNGTSDPVKKLKKKDGRDKKMNCRDKDNRKDNKMSHRNFLSSSTSKDVFKIPRRISGGGGYCSGCASKVAPVAQAQKDQEPGGPAVPSVEGEDGHFTLKVKDSKKLKRSKEQQHAVVTQTDKPGASMVVQQHGNPPPASDFNWKVPLPVPQDNVGRTAGPVKKLKICNVEPQNVGHVNNLRIDNNSWDKDYQRDESSDHNYCYSSSLSNVLKSSPSFSDGGGGDGSSSASKVDAVVQAKEDEEPWGLAVPSVDKGEKEKVAVVTPTDKPGPSMVVQQHGAPPLVPNSSYRVPPPVSQVIVDGAAGPVTRLISRKRAPQTISIVAKVPKSSDHHLFSSSSFSDVLKSSSTFSGDGGGEGSSPASIVAPVAVAEKDHKTGGPAVPLVDKGEDGHSTFMVTDGKNYLKTSKQQQNVVVTPADHPGPSMVVQQHGPPSPIPDSSNRVPPPVSQDIVDGAAGPENQLKSRKRESQSISSVAKAPKSSSSLNGGDGSSSTSKLVEVAPPKMAQESGRATGPSLDKGEDGHLALTVKDNIIFLKRLNEQKNVVVTPTDNLGASMVIKQQGPPPPPAPDSSSKVSLLVSQDNVDGTTDPVKKLKEKVIRDKQSSKKEMDYQRDKSSYHHFFSSSTSSNVLKSFSSFFGGDSSSNASKADAVAQAKKDDETAGAAVPSANGGESGHLTLMVKDPRGKNYLKRSKEPKNAVVNQKDNPAASMVVQQLGPSPPAPNSSGNAPPTISQITVDVSEGKVKKSKTSRWETKKDQETGGVEVPSADGGEHGKNSSKRFKEQQNAVVTRTPTDNPGASMVIQQHGPSPPVPDHSWNLRPTISQDNVDGTAGLMKKLHEEMYNWEPQIVSTVNKNDKRSSDSQRWDKDYHRDKLSYHHSFSSTSSSEIFKIPSRVSGYYDDGSSTASKVASVAKVGKDKQGSERDYGDMDYRKDNLTYHHSFPSSTSSDVFKIPTRVSGYYGDGSSSASKVAPVAQAKIDQESWAPAVPPVDGEDGHFTLKRSKEQQDAVVTQTDYSGASLVIQQQGSHPPVPDFSSKVPSPVSQDNVDKTASLVKKLKSCNVEPQIANRVIKLHTDIQSRLSKLGDKVGQDKRISLDKDYRKDNSGYYDSFSSTSGSDVFMSSSSFCGGRGPSPPAPHYSSKAPPTISQDTVYGTGGQVKKSKMSRWGPQIVTPPVTQLCTDSEPKISNETVGKDKSRFDIHSWDSDYQRYKSSFHHSFSFPSSSSDVFKSSSSFSDDGGDWSSTASKVVAVAQAKKDQEPWAPVVPSVDWGEADNFNKMVTEGRNYFKRLQQKQNGVVTPTDNRVVIQKPDPSPPTPEKEKDGKDKWDMFYQSYQSGYYHSLSSLSSSSDVFKYSSGGDGSSSGSKVVEVSQAPKKDEEPRAPSVPSANWGENGYYGLRVKDGNNNLKRLNGVVTPTDNHWSSMVIPQQGQSPSAPDSKSEESSKKKKEKRSDKHRRREHRKAKWDPHRSFLSELSNARKLQSTSSPSFSDGGGSGGGGSGSSSSSSSKAAAAAEDAQANRNPEKINLMPGTSSSSSLSEWKIPKTLSTNYGNIMTLASNPTTPPPSKVGRRLSYDSWQNPGPSKKAKLEEENKTEFERGRGEPEVANRMAQDPRPREAAGRRDANMKENHTLRNNVSIITMRKQIACYFFKLGICNAGSYCGFFHGEPTSPAASVPSGPPATSVPRSPAPSIPRSPASFVPRSPASFVPRSPASFVPRSFASFVPRSPAPSVPRSPASFVQRSPAPSFPSRPASFVPRSPAPSVPRSPDSFVPRSPAPSFPSRPAPSVPRSPATSVPRSPAPSFPRSPATSFPSSPFPSDPRRRSGRPSSSYGDHQSRRHGNPYYHSSPSNSWSDNWQGSSISPISPPPPNPHRPPEADHQTHGGMYQPNSNAKNYYQPNQHYY